MSTRRAYPFAQPRPKASPDAIRSRGEATLAAVRALSEEICRAGRARPQIKFPAMHP